tara:strand:- start:491 stop:1279 length:789 start_codon:yes stop_codon:yes gene_type:complete
MQKLNDAVLTIEIKNQKPLDLLDLTDSLMAVAEAFRDYATQETGDPLPDNMRLHVRELRSGSVFADLIAMTDQAQWILEHGEVLAGFVGNLNEVMNFFMGRSSTPETAPTRREASQAIRIAEPIAKDTGSQLNIQVAEGGVVNLSQVIHMTTPDANAAQNGARRYLGPAKPASYIATDQLLTLEQVKNSAKSKTGDRGIIETIGSHAVKLQFLSEDAKRKVLELEENPLQSVFIVDVEVRSVEGKAMLYRIVDVKDSIPKDS